MGTLILTSCGLYTNSIKDEFIRLINGKPSNLTVGIITTASEQKSKNRFAIQAKDDFLSIGIGNVEFIDVEFDDITSLDGYDVIYINGGNPFYLLYHLKSSGADKKLYKLMERNAIIIGVSAGTVVLGPDISVVNFFTPHLNTVKLDDLSALRLTDIAVFPHYDRKDLFPSDLTLEERLLKYEEKYRQKVIRMADDEAVLIEKDKNVRFIKNA